jgi:hypothetical protein
MKNVVLLSILLLMVSCSNMGHIVSYGVSGDATDVTVTYTGEYGEEITVSVSLPWQEKVFIYEGVEVSMKAVNSGTGMMHASIYYQPHIRTLSYTQTSHPSEIVFRGVIK